MSLRWNSTTTGLIIQTDLINDGEFPSLAAAIVAIGTKTATIVVTKNIVIREDLTSPCNISYVISRNGGITINTGVTLTIDGNLSAGAYTVFSGLGDVRLNGDATPFIYPQWFSDDCDGSYTNADVVKANASIYVGTALVFQAGAFVGSVTVVQSTLGPNGFVTFSNAETEKVVTLTGIQIQPNSNYGVFPGVEPGSGAPGVGAWVKDGVKTTTGFTLQISGPPGTGKSIVVRWAIIR